jgi:SpoVK/Ycf46/Vps4 family AAA+-type ATPase
MQNTSNALAMCSILTNIDGTVKDVSKELFGVEYQTRSCLNKINMYLSLPGLMHQPLIMNFWGPTGTGKTQLAKKLVELIGLQDRFIQINLASTGSYNWKKKMEDISELVSGEDAGKNKPVVLLFDEIQHARVLNEENKEVQREGIGDLWGILDKGIEFVTSKPIQTIIFVAGNIDLYEAENVSNWEGLPDEEQQEQSMPVQFIHDALSKRFRPEMLARFRNNHFLFPPINKKRALQMIERDLNHTQTTLKEYCSGVNLCFDHNFIDYLFNRVPSKGMGARGIEATVNEIVKSDIVQWLVLVTDNGYTLSNITEIHLKGYKDELMVTIQLDDSNTLHHKRALKLERVYNVQCNPEEIAVHAVHEAGHALASFLAGGTVPQLISVGSGIGKVKAFVQYAHNNNLVSRRDVIKITAQALGGLLAEEIVFGKDEVTHGSGKDIECIYDVVSKSLLEAGHGKSLLIRKISSGFVFDTFFPQPREDDFIEVEQFIHEVAEQTRTMLFQQENALRALAKQLFYRGELNSDEFIDILDLVIDKALFAQHHNIEQKDLTGNCLTLRDQIKQLHFNYVDALFGESKVGTSAREFALIGPKKARENNLWIPDGNQSLNQSIETTVVSMSSTIKQGDTYESEQTASGEDDIKAA